LTRIRKRLTYANVMSSIAVFLVIGGGAAYAAKKIGSHQLKPNSVTTAKIKKNAVTTAKIKNNAVTGAKIKSSSTPFARVVAKPRGSTPVSATAAPQVFPLSPSTYTQEAEEDDSYLGGMNVTFEPTCAPPRSATGVVVVDAPNPTAPTIEQLVALGTTEDKTGGTVSKHVELGPYLFLGTRFEPGAPTSHTVNLIVEAECETGSGVKVTSAGVDVIGTK
jgi:hypothetical protein